MTRLPPARRVAVMLALGLCITGLRAQHAPAAQPAELPYRSTLAPYQRFEDQPVRPWKESNDTVGRIGGWKAYAREASGEAPPDAAPAPPSGAMQTPKPQDAGHGAHHHEHHR